VPKPRRKTLRSKDRGQERERVGLRRAFVTAKVRDVGGVEAAAVQDALWTDYMHANSKPHQQGAI